VDTLLFLDVLEHVDDPANLLERCRTAFPAARRLLVTLPARTELWSNYDEYFGHRQRYTRTTARELLQQAGVRPIDVRYYFHLLYPPAAFLHAVGAPRSTDVHAPRSAAARLAHLVVAGAMKLGARVAPAWLPGTSLYAVGEYQR